jgi:beta-lactamase class D
MKKINLIKKSNGKKYKSIRVNPQTMKIMKSLNRVQSRNLIHNQINFKRWNHEKYQFKKFVKEKKIAIKRKEIKFD